MWAKNLCLVLCAVASGACADEDPSQPDTNALPSARAERQSGAESDDVAELIARARRATEQGLYDLTSADHELGALQEDRRAALERLRDADCGEFPAFDQLMRFEIAQLQSASEADRADHCGRRDAEAMARCEEALRGAAMVERLHARLDQASLRCAEPGDGL
ncbi:MAG: hypothetical protein AAFW46_05420 [Pseudomonadota bacterium]